MARKGLFEKVQVATSDLSRVQDNVRKAVEQLAVDHDTVSSPVTAMVATGNVPSGASLVSYTGGPGNTLTLPPANSLGTNTGAVVIIVNTSTSAVTLQPSRGDTINGLTSISLPGGAVADLASDGISKWLTSTAWSGTWTDFTQDLGSGAVSGTFDVAGLTGLVAGKNVAVVQTAQPIASKGNARDEFLFNDIQATGYVVDANTIRVYWNAGGIVVGTYAFAYQVGG